MKHVFLSIATFISLVSLAITAHAEVPNTLHHQGRISVQDVNFDGIGDFRFLLYYGKTPGTPTQLIWQNDNQKPQSLTAPTTPVTVPVTKGLYSVQLGAHPQIPLPPLRPSGDEQLYLRIWFDDGANGIQQLSPDREISSVPFALRAASVANGSITSSSLSSSVNIPNVLSGVTQIPLPQYWIGSQFSFSATFPTPFPSAPIVASTPTPYPTIINEVTASGFSGTADFPALSKLPTDTISTGSVSNLSGGIVNGRPAVSFYDEDDQTLKFAINANTDGSGTWATSTIASGTFSGQISYSSLAVIDGKPAVAFMDGVGLLGLLKFAINSAADGSGTWSINTVAPGAGTIIGSQSLAMIDGRPAIIFSDSNVTPGLQFAINSVADGSGTWNLSAIGFPGAVFEGAALAVVDGRPAIAYHDRFGGFNSSLRFAINSMADATGPWTMTIIQAASNSNPGSNTPFHAPRLALVNGFPAISYYFSGNANPTMNSHRYRINAAIDATGLWSEASLVGAGSDTFQSGLTVIGGIPVVSHTAETGLSYPLSISVLAPAGWDSLTIAEESSGSDMVDLGGTPGIFYIENELKFWSPRPIEIQWIAVGQ